MVEEEEDTVEEEEDMVDPQVEEEGTEEIEVSDTSRYLYARFSLKKSSTC